MPIKCYTKPNRTKTRNFNAKAVARIYCTAVQDGVDPDEIDELIEECMNDDLRRKAECSCVALYRTLRNVLTALAAVGVTLLALRTLPVLISIIPRALLPAAARAAIQQLPRAGRIIEGEFTIIRETLSRANQLRSVDKRLTIDLIGGAK
jgi:hypothetical protein